MSTRAAVASAFIAGISAIASTVSAIYGVNASRDLGDAQRRDAAQAAISQYVVQMSELDRTGGSSRRNEIVALATQVDSLIAQYGQSELHLSASTYRLVGLFLTLSTTDLELAERMARESLKLSARMKPDGAGGLHMSDPLEALQAHRVIADVAAQNLDLAKMDREYEAALDITESEGKRNRYIRVEARRFTRVYWALSAMKLVDDLGKPNAAQCREVRRRADVARVDFEALGKNPEVGRRARRIESNRCSTWLNLGALQKY
ncbi:hypothetical protein ACWCP6_00610 [Streptomyces sp. NPDC002004]